MANEWAQGCYATGSDTNPGLHCTPDGDVSSCIQKVWSLHECVYVEHANNCCCATNSGEGKDASNEYLHRPLHHQTPDNEEW